METIIGERNVEQTDSRSYIGVNPGFKKSWDHYSGVVHLVNMVLSWDIKEHKTIVSRLLDYVSAVTEI